MLYRIIKDRRACDKTLLENDVLTVIERHWEKNNKFYFIVEYNFTPTYLMIPGILYNGNNYGSHLFPKFTLAKMWFFREDRCTLPSAAIVENSKYVLAVFTEPARSDEELSCVGVRGNKIIIRIPWMEIPLSYSRKQHFSHRVITYFKHPVEYKRKFYIIFTNYRKLGYTRGFHFVLDYAWELFGEDVIIDKKQLYDYLKLKVQFAINWHYIKLKHVSSFLQFLIPNTPICGGLISASFTGKALEMALALYRLYLMNGDKKLKEIAFSVANFHCRGLRKNGLLLTDYHIFRRRWVGYFFKKRKFANTRQIGEALYALLRLYKLAKSRNEENKLWLLVAMKVGNFFLRNQLKNEDFGCWWSLDGKGVKTDGTNGAYIIWFLTELYEITKNSKYLETAEKAMNFYLHKYVNNDVYWGDTLDANTIDREGAHGIMKAALLLYEKTGKTIYLKIAERAAYFILSWMLFWNIPFNKRTLLGRLNFKSKGWTIVSVENQHLDPYGLIIAPDFIRLSKFTGKKLWYEVGLLMARSVIDFFFTISKHGLDPLFIGYQPEQIYHTEWSYFQEIYSFLYMLIVHGILPTKKKGCVVNNVFWTIAGCVNSILDLMEELGIKIEHLVIDYYEGIRYKILRKVRDFIAQINFIC